MRPILFGPRARAEIRIKGQDPFSPQARLAGSMGLEPNRPGDQSCLLMAQYVLGMKKGAMAQMEARVPRQQRLIGAGVDIPDLLRQSLVQSLELATRATDDRGEIRTPHLDDIDASQRGIDNFEFAIRPLEQIDIEQNDRLSRREHLAMDRGDASCVLLSAQIFQFDRLIEILERIGIGQGQIIKQKSPVLRALLGS